MKAVLYILIASLLLNMAFVGKRVLNDLYPKVESSTDDKYLHERNDLFRHLPKDSGAVFFVGHSQISEYPVYELFPGIDVKNRGVSGSETKNSLERIDDVVRQKPRSVFLLEGINDIKNGVPFDSTIARYRRIVQRLQGINYYLISVLPTSKTWDGREKNIQRLNDTIKTLGKFIDLYPAFVKDGKLNDAYTYDGLHLNDKGYQLMTDSLKKYVRK